MAIADSFFVFGRDSNQLLIPLIGKTVQGMLEKLPASGEVEIEVSEWFQEVTEYAITRTALGRSYDDGKDVFQLQTKQMVFAAEAFRKKNTMSWKLDKEIRRGLTALIRRRKESSNDEKPGGRHEKDLLRLMINASASSPGGITTGDMVEECKTFFFAGKQTTSNLLTWATVLLAMHPEWQERARAEVLQVCGSRNIPTRDHLAELKTVRRLFSPPDVLTFSSSFVLVIIPFSLSPKISQLGLILNETLRLYPPAVATIRRAKADVEIGDYRIPRGTDLLIPIIAVHHDERLWGPDVARFDPGRFAEGVSRAALRPTAFIPFGLGGRTCVGQNLALLVARLTLAIILQRSSFRLSPAYVHAPTVLMLLYPQYGAPILFRPLPSQPSPQSCHNIS
ncbi:hypothetical protein B296_00001711 [Ensete ventricosum]|uniref:Cytochrome P450 n=1 Tax=Ensete ventricosum TaxID=4639 RepID=A0A427B4W7_ENSVE|nr:hypothetical protein B296_00001711 [Ensete ventricosum]